MVRAPAAVAPAAVPPASATARRLALVSAAIGWAALLVQLALSLRLGLANGKSLPAAVVTYFSYFTILTNILAALCLTLPIAIPASAAGRFFARSVIASGVAMSMAMVGITYSLLLRHTWNPQGIQRLVDSALHDVMPLLFLAWWWIGVKADRLPWSAAVAWAAYPAAYFGYALARGAAIGEYPYPFIDAGALGHGRVFVNGLAMLAGFLGVGLLLLALGRWKRNP